MGEPVLIEGFLVKAPEAVKHLHNFKKWQRKWFQLKSNGDLFYYDNEKSTKIAGVVHLARCNRLFDAKSQGVQMSFCIGIDVGDMVVYVKAMSQKSFQEWVKPMVEFAESCDIEFEAIEKRGTICESQRHGSVVKGDSFSERVVESHHLTVSTKAKFLSKEGWLAKTGANNKGWKNRFFKLRNGKFFYYNSDKAAEGSALGDIDLFQCTKILNATGKKGFGIDIQLPGRVYNLSSETKEECDDWYSVLCSTLAQITDINSSSGVKRDSFTDTHSPETHSEGQQLLASHGAGEQGVLEAIGGKNSISSGSPTSGGKAGNTVRSFAESLGTKEDNKDTVVMLLEAEVEALRDQLTAVRADLKLSTAQNNHLTEVLTENERSYTISQKESIDEREQLQLQVSRLEKSKVELEVVNDSVITQLEEQLGKVQELEEDLLLVRQEFDESQTTNSAMEEELSESQQRLREIEAVAQQLEEALNMKESNPVIVVDSQVSPDSDNAQKNELQEFNEEVCKLTEEKKRLTAQVECLIKGREEINSQVETLAEEKRVSVAKVKILSEEKDLFTSQFETLKTEKEVLSSQVQNLTEEKNVLLVQIGHFSSEATEDEVQSKRQGNGEILNYEFQNVLESERESWEKERKHLENEIRVLKENLDLVTSKGSAEVLEFELTMTRNRVDELESEFSRCQDSLNQLQIQKDKAVSDLIALRKTNRNIEKKMSESDEPRLSSPLSPQVCQPGLPDEVTDLEKPITSVSTYMGGIQYERDAMGSTLKQSSVTPDFGFNVKTTASVAGNNVSMTFPRNSEQLANPPPKPRKPPQVLLNKLNEHDSHPLLEKKVRARTASIIKSIKTLIV